MQNNFQKLGYQSIVFSYRFHPYTQDEGAFDLQRTVFYVRKNAITVGIDSSDIIVGFFSWKNNLRRIMHRLERSIEYNSFG